MSFVDLGGGGSSGQQRGAPRHLGASQHDVRDTTDGRDSGNGWAPQRIPLSSAASLPSTPLSADPHAAFRRKWDAVSSSVFQISSNIATIQRLLALFGGSRDTADMRQQLHDVAERSRELIKTVSAELKHVMAFQPSGDERQVRLAQKKLQKDFEEVLRRFQAASKLAAEKSREFVIRARAHQNQQQFSADGDNGGPTENEPLLGRSSQITQLQILDSEIEFNEALIAEREEDLVGIERSIQEVNEIFRDMGTLVNEQQYLLDNIETNVGSVAVNMENATGELRTASKYQLRSRSFMCWILGILLVICLIMLAILHPWTWGHS